MTCIRAASVLSLSLRSLSLSCNARTFASHAGRAAGSYLLSASFASTDASSDFFRS